MKSTISVKKLSTKNKSKKCVAKTTNKKRTQKSSKKTKQSPLHRIIPIGRTISTKDNFLGKERKYSTKKRGCVIIEVNNKNELLLVPLSSQQGQNRTELKGYAKNYIIKNGRKQKAITYYKHFVEIEDEEGNPIVINEKFKENHKNMDLTQSQVEEIKNTVFNKAKQKHRNTKLLNKFKNK